MHPVDAPSIFDERDDERTSRPSARAKARGALEPYLQRSVRLGHGVAGWPNLPERDRCKIHSKAMDQTSQKAVSLFEWARSESEALRL